LRSSDITRGRRDAKRRPRFSTHARATVSDHKKRQNQKICNYSGMLIGLLIAILYFLTRKITAECAEERRVVNRLFPLRATLRTLPIDKKLHHRLPNRLPLPFGAILLWVVRMVTSARLRIQNNVENQKVRLRSTARIRML
jgi:hypothetical protein